MKLCTLAAAALIGVATTSSALGCVNPCNFTGVDVNLGTVSIGQKGTIFEDLALYPEIYNDLGVSLAYGYIPSNSEILFTYTFAGLQNNPTNALTSAISYNYVLHGKTYAGFSNGDSLVTSGPFGPGVLNQQGSINGSSVGPAGISQVFATASLPNLTAGDTSIVSYAHGLQEFTTTLLGYFNSAPPGTVTIQYKVVGLPLPASLPMMMLAMGGMFGFARAKQQRKAVAA